MALQTFGVNGNIEMLYTILQGCGLFNTVTSSVVEGTRTIDCNDASGVRLRFTCTNVDANGRETGSSVCGFLYFYGNGSSHGCGENWGDTSVTDSRWFPFVVYKTTSSLIICNGATYDGTKSKDCLFVISKDNNNELCCLSSQFNALGYAIWTDSWFLTKGATSPIEFGSGELYTTATTTTLVPFASSDPAKAAFSPKVFRAVNTQLQTTQIGKATMNGNDYVCLYGPVFVRID